MPDWLLTIILALLTAGFGLSVFSIMRGVDLFRGRTARTEARGIAFIERTWREDEWAKRVAIHRMEYYRDEQNTYLRRQVARLERVIIRELGEEKLPPHEVEPLMRPLPPRPIELTRGDDKDDDRTDATANSDG